MILRTFKFVCQSIFLYAVWSKMQHLTIEFFAMRCKLNNNSYWILFIRKISNSMFFYFCVDGFFFIRREVSGFILAVSNFYIR